MSACTYCRENGHSKNFCPALRKKVAQKKARRDQQKTQRRFSGIVKKFGTSAGALDGLWDEAMDVVKRFRALEEGAEGLSGEVFDERCELLASMEEEYEEKCAFLDFLESSEIKFNKKESRTTKKAVTMFEALSEDNPDEMSDEEELTEQQLMLAEKFYENRFYRKGERVFYGLLAAGREERSKLKERFGGNSWKTEAPQEVFSIGKALAAEKPTAKQQMGRREKKKSQKQILKANKLNGLLTKLAENIESQKATSDSVWY